MDNDSVSFPILILNIILNIIVNVSMLLSYYFHTYSLYRFLIINRTYTVKRNRVSLILWRYRNFALLLLLLLCNNFFVGDFTVIKKKKKKSRSWSQTTFQSASSINFYIYKKSI